MDRGQTNQDYVVGVSVMLLTLVAVFSFVPGIFTSFNDQVDSDEQALADRISYRLLEQASVAGKTNTLEWTTLEGEIDESSGDFADFRNRLGVKDNTRINVRVFNRSGRMLESGEEYDLDRRVAAISVRIFTFQDPSRCSPTCRMVVRVW